MPIFWMLEYFTFKKCQKIAFFSGEHQFFTIFGPSSSVLRGGGCNELPSRYAIARHCATRSFLLASYLSSVFPILSFFRFPSFARHCSSFFSQVTMPSLHASTFLCLMYLQSSLLVLRAFVYFFVHLSFLRFDS